MNNRKISHHASRLWSRTGLRLLSVFVLLLALIGGGYLTVDRHQQQANAASDARFASELKIAQLRQQAYLAASPQRDAQAAAQQSANRAAAAVASSAAVEAQKAENAARLAAGNSTSRSSTRTPVYGPIPTSCKAYTGNRAIGCSLVLAAGMGLEQMVCLDRMWTHESNWRTNADNPSSHSYGIPQALPASKMAAFGSDYRTNPATQIKWGLSYVKQRYGTPCGAWTFWQAHSWY
jgi:hypothetical protein